MKRFLSFLALALGVVAATAQGNDTIRLETVEIKRYKFRDSVAMEIVPAGWADLEGPGGLVASLRQYSSAWVRQSGVGGPATVSLDGMNPQHTQVLWNGLPVNNAFTGSADLSVYPSAAGLQLRLNDAGGSPEYGAAGGTLWLESVYRGTSGLDLELLTGSYGRWEVQGSGRWVSDSGATTVKLDAGYAMARNDYPYRDYNSVPLNEATLPHAGFTRFFVDPGWQWKKGNRHRLRTDLHWSGASREVPPTVIAPNNRSRVDDDAVRAAFHWRHTGNYVEGELQAGYTFDFLDYGEENAGVVVRQSAYRAHQALVGYRMARSFGRHEVRAGGRLAYHRGTGPGIPMRQLIAGGFFAQWEARFAGDRLRTELSLRPGGQSGSGMAWDYAASLQWQPSPLWPLAFYLSAAADTRFPTLADRYFEPSGNEDLERESAWKVKGGFRLWGTAGPLALRLDGSAYHTWLRDMILWVPTGKQYWQPLNLDGVRARGFAAVLSMALKPADARWQLEALQSYRFSVSTNEAELRQESLLFPNNLTLGRQLPYIPVHQYKAGLRAGYAGFYVLGNAVYTSERFINGSNSYYLPGFWLLHLAAGYGRKVGGFSLNAQFRVRNLTGNWWYQEVAHIPMPPRHYEFTLAVGYAKK